MAVEVALVAEGTIVSAIALETVMVSAGILGSNVLAAAATSIGLESVVVAGTALGAAGSAVAATWLAGGATATGVAAGVETAATVGGAVVGGGAAGGATAVTGGAIATGGAAAGGAAGGAAAVGGATVGGGAAAAGGATAATGSALASGGVAAGSAAAGGGTLATGATGGTMAATGGTVGLSAGAAVATTAGAIIAIALAFWLGWMAYNWISRGKLIRLSSEITVWTPRDTQVLAEKLMEYRESSEDEVKQVMCNELWLEPKAFVKPLPADPLGRAQEGAAYQLLLTAHKMWPMTGDKKDIIAWMLRGYQRDINDHCELEHAFDIHISSLRSWTKSVENWEEKITRLSRLEKISFVCDEPGIPCVVICGKTGSGKSTLSNALFHGCLEEKRVEQTFTRDSDDSDDDMKDDSNSTSAVYVPRAQVFAVGETAQAKTTQPKMMRSIGEKSLYIIDTPGLADTKGRDDEFQQQTVTALHSLDKVSCFILCLNMAERSTKESKNQVAFFENQYGKNVWDHTIVVFTHCTSVAKRNLTSDELKEQFWYPLWKRDDDPTKECLPIPTPAKIISMDNIVRDDFSQSKLKVLFKKIQKLNKAGGVDTSEFTTEIKRTEEKIDNMMPQIEKCKNDILELLIRDEYLVDSITSKRSVMTGRVEYKSVDDLDEEVKPKSSDIENEEGSNELMKSMIVDLRASAKEKLKIVRENTKKIHLLLDAIKK